MYIYQQDDWPHFTWNNETLLVQLGKVRNMQGKLIGKMESLGFKLRSEAVLDTLTLDVLKSSEIEGEILNPEQVRSSLARRLGMDISGLVSSDRNVEGVVDMMLDATQHFDKPFTTERLFDWHSAFFPILCSQYSNIAISCQEKNRNFAIYILDRLFVDCE